MRRRGVSGNVLPPLLLVGAGRMGGALFAGWAARGVAPSVIVDPAAAPGLARPGDTLVADLAGVPAGFVPAAVILAVKPQMADGVLQRLAPVLAPDTVTLSIMAGRRIAGMAAAIGGGRVIVRAMPNTPAAIGKGMTVACAGEGVSPAQRALCDALLRAVGQVAWWMTKT